MFASALGLGIDESYMVAAGRKLQLSYFDHPPIAWWLAWGAAHLSGSETEVIVRLPFIALFALTTLLMYRLTSTLFGAAAGLWAAVVLNAAWVLGSALVMLFDRRLPPVKFAFNIIDGTRIRARTAAGTCSRGAACDRSANPATPSVS